MAVVIAKSAATLAKALIRRNVAGVIVTSTKGMLSQVWIFFILKHSNNFPRSIKEKRSAFVCL